jgi:uncharacterized membrane protein YphA (DoxX/SURF4 family)
MAKLRTSALTMPRAFFGRVLLAAMVIAFGIEFAIAGHPLAGLPPLPWQLPHPSAWAITMSILLPLLGVAVLARFRMVESAFALGLVLLIGAGTHLLHLTEVLHDPIPRNNFLFPVALACGAFVLCGLARQSRRNYMFLAARALFAFVLIGFSINHFLYLGTIASMIPDWIPQHAIWARITGACFLLAGIAILTGYLARPAALLLFVLFGLFFVILDVPAIQADRRDANARIHGEMVLALCGAALLMATSPRLPSLENNMALEPHA